MTPAEVADAVEAKTLINAFKRTGRLPLEQFLAVRGARLKNLIESFPETLSDVQMARIGLELAMLINASRSFKATKTRGVGKLLGSGVEVPAIGVVAVDMKGYCLDKELPAPGGGARIRLRPANLYLNGPLADIEQAVLDYAAANPNAVDYHQLQHVLWGLRGVESVSPYTISMAQRRDLLDILNRAKPGSSIRFLETAMKADQKRKSEAFLRKLLPIIGDLEKIGVSLDKLSSKSSGAQSVDSHLAMLRDMPTTGDPRSVPEEAAYSILAPGVYAVTEGTNSLEVRTHILNVSGQQFAFIPSEWVAETQLAQQRVAFTSIKSAASSPGAIPSGNYEVSDHTKDAVRAMTLKALGMADPAKAKSYSEKLAANNKFIASAAMVTGANFVTAFPVVGNVLSAAEFLSGQDLFMNFGKPLSSEERILAGLGAIPGYGSMFKVAGGAGKLSSIVAKALESPAVTKVLKTADRVEMAKDIAGVGDFLASESDAQFWNASADIAQKLLAEYRVA
ncbi:hypothetical protein [Sulfurisoma sediminicola]|nr:hypothetical protein [Sulfurisoma sediminicola]